MPLLHYKTNLKGNSLKYHFMTEMEVKLQAFLTFIVDECELPVSRSGRFDHLEGAAGTILYEAEWAPEPV